MSEEFKRQWKWHMEEGFVKVGVSIPNSNGSEWLWCEPLGESLLKVCNVPFFVDEPSINDVIEVLPENPEQGFYRFDRVVEHVTEPLFFCYQTDVSDEVLKERFKVFWEACDKHDFRVESFMRGYVVVAVPWGKAEESKRAILESAESARLDLEEMGE